MNLRTPFAAAGMALGLLSLSLPVLAAAETYKIDPAHTLVTFKLNHLGFSSANGWFGEINGDIVVDMDNPVAGSVEAVLSTESVDTNHDERDAWIKSDKVLNASVNPTISFTSTNLEVTGEKTFEITGDMTMNGVTKPITLDAVFNNAGENPITKEQTIGFSATGVVKRSEFGVDAFVGALGDDVSFSIDVEAVLVE